MIRLATTADIPAILEIYGPYVLETTTSFEYTVPTQAEFAARFRHHTHYCPWLVWEENGRILGYAYGAPKFERAGFAWCAEISVYLRPEAQRRGIGRKLCEALEKILFWQGYRVIYAVVTACNTASVAFHEALGFTKCAELKNCGYKFGRCLGTIWLEKQGVFVDYPPNFPLLWSDIVDNDEIPQNILAILSIS